MVVRIVSKRVHLTKCIGKSGGSELNIVFIRSPSYCVCAGYKMYGGKARNEEISRLVIRQMLCQFDGHGGHKPSFGALIAACEPLSKHH